MLLACPIGSSYITVLPLHFSAKCLKGRSKFIISESLQFGGKFYRKTWLILLPLLTPLFFGPLFFFATSTLYPQCLLFGLINETICFGSSKRAATMTSGHWASFTMQVLKLLDHCRNGLNSLDGSQFGSCCCCCFLKIYTRAQAHNKLDS